MTNPDASPLSVSSSRHAIIDTKSSLPVGLLAPSLPHPELVRISAQCGCTVLSQHFLEQERRRNGPDRKEREDI